MRLNRVVASRSNLSRRQADQAISDGRVKVNNKAGELGQSVGDSDQVILDDVPLTKVEHQYLLLNKPVGFVCSRDGQGGKTIYELLPKQYQHLQTVGRLDKDSRGLLLLTNDGALANQLTHPSFAKLKTYKVALNKDLSAPDKAKLINGVELADGLSRLKITGTGKRLGIQLAEGRNRQIRRSFQALGYQVTDLQRTGFSGLNLASLTEGSWQLIKREAIK